MSTPTEIVAAMPQGSVLPQHCISYVLRKLQRDLNSIEMWCKRWNIKIDDDKTRVIYFSHRLRPPEVHLTYLGIIFNERITWRFHIEIIEDKAFRTFIRV
jgi:hypothetical protein